MTRRLHWLIVLLAAHLGVAALPAQAQAAADAGVYRVRPSDSLVQFTISKWTVFKEEGRFRDFQGTIHYDPADPAASRVEFQVRVASVDTKAEGRDKTLQDEDFFYAARYPTMSFRSTAVRAAGERTLLVTGELTIRGVTRTITVPVELLGVHQRRDSNALAGFETTFTIDRRQFGVLGLRWSGGELILGNEVTIRLIASAEKIGALARR